MSANALAGARVRELMEMTTGVAAQDGDGVRMTRMIGSPQLDMLDPFLLFDVFGSDEPLDYIGGFPDHPHRGFETVTYMLAGRMRHRDSAGNEGVIGPGGVQWMTAGRGIVHSEMPEQEEGLLAGFQLWVNLPRRSKMREPGYQEFAAEDIALETLANGGTVKVIAGSTDSGTRGPVVNDYVDALYLDASLPSHGEFVQTVAADASAFVYVISGEVGVGSTSRPLGSGQLGILGPGVEVRLASAEEGARFLLVAGRPLREAVARHGPFVMSSREEILQAFDDYRNNRF